MKNFFIALGVSILFTGDILLDRGVRPYLDRGGMSRVIPDETADFSV